MRTLSLFFARPSSSSSDKNAEAGSLLFNYNYYIGTRNNYTYRRARTPRERLSPRRNGARRPFAGTPALTRYIRERRVQGAYTSATFPIAPIARCTRCRLQRPCTRASFLFGSRNLPAAPESRSPGMVALLYPPVVINDSQRFPREPLSRSIAEHRSRDGRAHDTLSPMRATSPVPPSFPPPTIISRLPRARRTKTSSSSAAGHLLNSSA